VDLSEHERALLSDIGVDLWREDPQLARSLSKPAGHRRRILTYAIALVAFSAVVEIAGALARQPLACALAWLGMTIGAVLIGFNHGQPGRLPGGPG
jgi:hypothetical protein